MLTVRGRGKRIASSRPVWVTEKPSWVLEQDPISQKGREREEKGREREKGKKGGRGAMFCLLLIK